MSDRIFVIAPDGKKGSVPREQLDGALKAGFAVDETRAAAAYSSGTAFGTGVARGLTFGLSDYLDLPGGPVLQEAKKAVRDENPVASFAGEFAGSAINPASRISAGATTVKGAMALGAVEGGLFGLGSALTEDALGDQQALSEQLAARVGGGALMGGALAGAFQKVLGGVERLTLSEESAALPKVLTDYAEKASSTVRKSSITDDEALRKAGVSWDSLHKWAKDEGLFNRATSPEGLFEQADVAVQRSNSLVADTLAEINQRDLPNPSALLRAVEPFAADESAMLTNPTLVNAARRAQKYLGEQEIQALPRFDPTVSADAIAGGGNQTYTWDKLLQNVDLWSKSPRTQPLADALRTEALAQARAIDGDLATKLEKGFQGRVYAEFLKKELAGADSSIDVGGVVGNAAVAGLWGGPGAALGSAASQVAGRAAQKRGPFVVANVLDNLPNASALKPLAESLLTQVKARLNTAPELLGPFRVVLENAAAEGAASLLGTHMQLAQGPNGNDYLSTLGLVREGAGDIEPYSQKAQTMAALMKLQAQVEERLGAAVEGKADDASIKDFRQAYDAVQKLVKQPVIDDKLGALPATSMGLTAQLAKAAQHVWDSAPKDPNEHLPPALRAPWEPTAMEKARFLARTQAAFEPVAAINAMLQGDLAQERLATLSALYPRLLEQATQKLFERLNSNKPLSWEQRQRLTPLLGPEALGLTAQQSAIIASVHAKSVEGAEAEARVNGRQVVDQSKNMQSQSQRIEARRSST